MLYLSNMAQFESVIHSEQPYLLVVYYRYLQQVEQELHYQMVSEQPQRHFRHQLLMAKDLLLQTLQMHLFQQ